MKRSKELHEKRKETKMATEIKANAIYKILNQNCWAVPSNSSDTLYRVCFDEASSNWTCTCKHGEIQASRGQSAKCCHVAAVQISVKANLQQEQEAYASRLHNGVTLESYNKAIEAQNCSSDAKRTAENNYCLSMDI
jgi:hypothetical protein